MSRMISVAVLVVSTVVGLLATLAVAAGPASADPGPPLPENYNFLAGIPSELANPGGSLPGSNDFTCRPSAEHPRPVILVHGTGGSQQTNWGAFVPMLANRGYCVFAPTLGAIPGAPWPISAIGGMDRMERSAAQLSRYVDRVLASTGAKQVDFVGHSQGGVLPGYYIKAYDAADKVHSHVAIAAPWQGTFEFATDNPLVTALLGGRTLELPICAACTQMSMGSAVYEKLWRGGSPYVAGVRYTNIVTRYDELVLPYTSGVVPGRPGQTVRNIVVQDSCAQDYSEHMAIAGSERTGAMVLNALDPSGPVSVPCRFIPPITG